MTKNGFMHSLKFRAVLIITVLCLLFTSVAMLSACGDDEEESTSITYPSASKTIETDDDELITNGDFEDGSYNLSSSSFPTTSNSNWSFALDVSGDTPSSSLTALGKGGIIDEDSWDTTLGRFKVVENFQKKVRGNDTTGDLTDEEFATYGFSKDSIFGENKASNRALMLNAYDSSAFGTAVKATYSSAITLDNNAWYKITVDVMTILNFHEDTEGANIRLINTVNGTEQEVAGIYGINTEKNWKQYTIYVHADENLTSTVKLVLGLGRAGDSQYDCETLVEGSAFFDNVSMVKIDEEPTIKGTKIPFAYGTENSQMIKAESNTSFYYNMSVDYGYEKTTEEKSLTISDFTNPTIIEDFTSIGTVEVNTFEFISFDIDTSALGKFDVYGATVYIVDSEGTEVSVGTYKYSEEIQNVQALIINNFTEEEGTDQTYSIKIVVGSTDSNPEYKATGSVTVLDISYVTGTIDEDNEKYNETMYNLYSSVADSTVYLYAGYGAKYTTIAEETYSFTAGEISINKDNDLPNKYNKLDVYNLTNYKGVDENSVYVTNKTEDGKNAEIDTKIIEGNAGLIKYNKENENDTLKMHETDNDYVQPLFINNTDAEHYGFIGESKTLSASSSLNVSMKVRVVGDAKAYIYIIDTTTMKPMVLTYTDNNGNTQTHEMVISLTSDKMLSDGWATVNFYLATGADSKSYRIELWNGSRTTDETEAFASTGVVFFDDVETSSDSFTSDRWEDLFVTGTLGTLLDETTQTFNEKDALYTQKLTDTEIEFNKEYPDDKVSYEPNYVWAKSEYTIFAVETAINPVETDPYESITEDEDEEEESCANADPSSFWLSFSSIILVVVIVLALVALILKNVIIKRRRNESDAKSHYKVQSRYSKKNDKKAEEKAKKVEETTDKLDTEVKAEEIPTETVEEADAEPTEEKKEETLDSYVYGDVQNFGDDLVTNEEKPAEETEVPTEPTETPVEQPVEQPTETVEEVNTEPAEEKKEEATEDKPNPEN